MTSQQKRSSQKKKNFRKRNKQTQKTYNKKTGGGLWELFGFAPDSIQVKQLKDQKKVCDTEAKTSIDKTNADIKVAEDAIATAKKGIEDIKKSQKICNAELDKKIDAQQTREKADELLKKSGELQGQGQGQQVNPMIAQTSAPMPMETPMPMPMPMETPMPMPMPRKDMYDGNESMRQDDRYLGQGGRSKRSKRSKK